MHFAFMRRHMRMHRPETLEEKMFGALFARRDPRVEVRKLIDPSMQDLVGYEGTHFL